VRDEGRFLFLKENEKKKSLEVLNDFKTLESICKVSESHTMLYSSIFMENLAI
jgi:hypothetical protein